MKNRRFRVTQNGHERGAGIIEYVALLALIPLLSISAVQALGPKVAKQFEDLEIANIANLNVGGCGLPSGGGTVAGMCNPKDLHPKK